jgi:hypothetical protein
MSDAGDCAHDGPFKEGTIKFACYNVLNTSGPRGLSVRSLHPSTTAPVHSPRMPLRISFDVRTIRSRTRSPQASTSSRATHATC